MSITQERRNERGRMLLLLPLMMAANVFLFLCMAGLGILALRQMAGPLETQRGGDANQQIVKAFLAERIPNSRYRIREWFPAMPLEGNPAATADNLAQPAKESGFAQRVKLVFYGPSGARQLDTTYWIQNGKVTRIVPAGAGRFAG